MPAVEDPRVLSSLKLFEGLNEKDLDRLNNELLQRRKFAGGTNIITVAQPGEVIFVLLQGSVKIYVDQIDGSEVILAFLGPGDTVGEMGLIGSSGRSASVLTLEETVCLAMDRGSFRVCLKTVPGLSFNLVQLLSRRLRLANEQVQALSTLDVRGRVARQLLAFAQRYGEAGSTAEVSIPLRLTQTDLASLVGASRERVNQVIVDFKDRRFISVDPGHHITVHEIQALIDRCQ
ncbi:MAG: Crp/Fnr family transcriptional regulator [Acidobacteriota bacterium]|nr:Crp/Fnr family transcriptional regulator [Acidobacteriota bacterium]